MLPKFRLSKFLLTPNGTISVLKKKKNPVAELPLCFSPGTLLSYSSAITMSNLRQSLCGEWGGGLIRSQDTHLLHAHKESSTVLTELG